MAVKRNIRANHLSTAKLDSDIVEYKEETEKLSTGCLQCRERDWFYGNLVGQLRAEIKSLKRLADGLRI